MALGSAALTAQTIGYGLNVVGCLNVTCLPGYNMIACQLQTPNNSLGTLISDGTGAIDTCQVYKFTGASYVTDTANSRVSPYANNWIGGGLMTMNPGESIWFKNPFKTNLTFTFGGTVPQGNLTVTAAGPNKFTMISSIVPQSDIVSNLGLTNVNGQDAAYVFNPTNQTYMTYFGTNVVTSPLLSLPVGDAFVNIGQGFWYKTAPGIGPVNWTRTFSINQ